MVGRLLMLKMLHCRSIRDKKRRPKKASGERLSHDERALDSFVKVERYEQDICRVCLKEGSIPILGNDTSYDITEDLNTFGGIEVNINDNYPKYLCHSCNALLQGAKIFRKTAQESDNILKQTENIHIKNEDSTHSTGCVEDFYKCKERKALEHEENNIKSINCENKNAYSNEDESQSSSSGNDNMYNCEDENTITNQDSTDCIDDSNEVDKAKKPVVRLCKRCDISFESFKAYNEHMMSEEHENMRRTCPVCHKTYTALYYKKHITLHMNSTTYMCDICGKNFIVKAQFTRHRLTHFYELPFKCSLCPYKGRFRESLRMHMRSHTGEKPYQCTQCPSRFISKSNLNNHMLTHKRERDFQCNSCGSGFYRKRDLEMHYKVNHAGIKDHVCNICGKAFGYRKQMMKHQLKVHKREKLKSGRMPLYLKVETMKQQEQHISNNV